MKTKGILNWGNSCHAVKYKELHEREVTGPGGELRIQCEMCIRNTIVCSAVCLSHFISPSVLMRITGSLGEADRLSLLPCLAVTDLFRWYSALQAH